MSNDPNLFNDLTWDKANGRLRAVMGYLCEKYPHPYELSNARLTKLVYLSDWEASRHLGRQLTPVDWVFNHYGPWVSDVLDEASTDDTFRIVDEINMHGSPKTRIALAEDTPSGSWGLTEHERAVIDEVIEATRRLYFGQFIDYVYNTYPVRVSRRYAHLNLPALAQAEALTEGPPDPLPKLMTAAAGGLSADEQRQLLGLVESVLREDLGSTPPGELAEQMSRWIDGSTLEWVDGVSVELFERIDPDTERVTAVAEASVEGLVDKSDVEMLSDQLDLDVRDYDWDRYNALVSATVHIEVVITGERLVNAQTVIASVDARLAPSDQTS